MATSRENKEKIDKERKEREREKKEKEGREEKKKEDRKESNRVLLLSAVEQVGIGSNVQSSIDRTKNYGARPSSSGLLVPHESGSTDVTSKQSTSLAESGSIHNLRKKDQIIRQSDAKKRAISQWLPKHYNHNKDTPPFAGKAEWYTWKDCRTGKFYTYNPWLPLPLPNDPDCQNKGWYKYKDDGEPVITQAGRARQVEIYQELMRKNPPPQVPGYDYSTEEVSDYGPYKSSAED